MVNLKKVELIKSGDVRIAKKKVDIVKHTGNKVNLNKSR